jgi:Tol biopolymer transport system component
MVLAPGTRLGVYEVLSAIGAGGMGEVYKARDTRLHRDVAVKVLPRVFGADADRLARFEREAHMLAALNHPNIAQVYGLEDWEGVRALVMELVDGQTLSDIVSAEGRRGLPLAGAWQIAGQIADALAAAHERGIVHRDLKPANVIVKSDGTVKVLDFGLAKPFESASIDAMNSPTVAGATEAGLILGTAAYMSPEQARGRPVDERCDIWAFGVVLYEMLTGQSCFGKETVSDTVAAVLTSDPDWTCVPAPARRLLTRCLEKDPKRRLRAIGDARFLIGDEGAEASPAPTRRTWIPWVAAGVLAAALAVSLALPRPQRDTRPLVRFDLDLGDLPARTLGVLAFSPDGTRIAVPVRGPEGLPVLSTRRIDLSERTLLQGTEGADQPFFSPDGQWIAFFAGNKLKKVPVQGGTSVEIADALNPRGGSWAEDGTIVAALANTSGLARVPAAGGTPQPLTTLQDGELTHRWPQVLPGTDAVLFTAHSGTINSYENASIVVLSRAGGARKTVWRGGYHGRFIPTDGKRGHLVFVHRGILHAVRFDANRLEVEGTPVPLIQDLASDPESAAGRFDFSRSGMFAFSAGVGVQAWTVARLQGNEKLAPMFTKPAMYYSPRFSPDGRRLAVAIDAGKGMDIVVHDFERDTTSPITFNAETNADPVWTSDGAHFVFRSLTANGWRLWWIRADGAGGPQPLLANAGEVVGDLSADAISRDNRRLIYARIDPVTAGDLWILPVDPSDPDRPKVGQPELFLKTPASETRPAFSPDGRWVAYNSNEGGTIEVYVRAAGRSSDAGGKWKISSGGGGGPVWSRTAPEIYFPRAGQIMVSEYSVRGSSFEASKPRVWSKQRLHQTGFTNFDLAPDGKQFAIVPEPSGSATEVRVTVLLNFFDELRRQIP